LRRALDNVSNFYAGSDILWLTREAVKVDGAKEGEEFDTMLRELREVFVDHFQCAFKHIFHDCRDLVFHKRLRSEVSHRGFNNVEKKFHI
jgi:hypothetical protein